MANTSRRPRWAADMALLGLLALLTAKVTYDIASVRDLNCYDEPSYMEMASAIPERGLPPAEACPLYCLWYRALSLVQPDSIRLSYLSWQLLIGLLVATIYLLCRAVGGTRPLALLAAFVALNSRLLDVQQSYCGLLTAVLVVGGTAVAACCRRWAWSLVVIGSSLLLASFVRPECALSFVLFGVASLVTLAWTLLRHPESWRGLVTPALCLLLLAGAVLGCLGNPLGGGRSSEAFCQWYAAHVVTARKLPIDPTHHFADICREDFGDATSVGAALQANPRAVLWHIGFNLRELPGALGKIAQPVLVASPGKTRWLSGVLGALLLLGLAGLCRRLVTRAAAAFPSERHGLLIGLSMLGLVLLPGLAACLIVCASPRYLTPAVVLLFVLLAAGLVQLPWGRTWRARLEAPAALALLGLLLLALAPNRAHGWCVQNRRLPSERNPLIFRPLVDRVRALPLRGPVTFLDMFLAATAVYDRQPQRFVRVQSKQGLGFQDFVQRYDVGVVILCPWLLNDVNFRDDPAFQEFAAGGWTDRFSYFPVPGGFFRVAVRNDLLIPR